jgi:hypothetical protein
MLSVENIVHNPIARSGAPRPRRAERRDRRRERRGKNLAHSHHRYEPPGPRRDPLSRSRYRGLAELQGLQSGSDRSPRGARSFRR